MSSLENRMNPGILKLAVDTALSAYHLDIMAGRLTQVLTGALGIKGTALFVVNPQTEELELAASAGLSTGYIHKGPILVDKSIQLVSNQEPVVISDILTSDRLQYPENARQEGIRAIVSLPVRLRGKLIGALRLYHSDVWEISPQDQAYLETIAQTVGMAMMYFRLATALSGVKETVDDIHSVWL